MAMGVRGEGGVVGDMGSLTSGRSISLSTFHCIVTPYRWFQRLSELLGACEMEPLAQGSEQHHSDSLLTLLTPLTGHVGLMCLPC